MPVKPSESAKAKRPKFVIQRYRVYQEFVNDIQAGVWYGIYSTTTIHPKEVARFRKATWAQEFIRRHA